MTDNDDPRRRKPITIRWDGMVGRLTIDGESWGAIEWSEERQAWCIEDAEGRCLSHHSHVHGENKDKDGAIALAEMMIRDGRMPTPQAAHQARNERLQRDRERRAKQPSEIRRRRERAKLADLLHAAFVADWENQSATPFYEIFAEAFDLADPDLWKSNSFSMVRPRLVIEVRAAIAKFEHELHDRRIKRRPPDPKLEHELARAREILALLTDGGGAR